MTILATAHVSSSAPPAAFFDRWADMATWPEWNLDTEWVRLDGPFTQGGTGTLKPKGGPQVRFEITELVTNRRFVDVSTLFGAKLTFDHKIDERPEGGSDIQVTVTMTGPLRALWTLILGKDVASSVEPDLQRLAGLAERLSRAS